jgi:hypothetical protein
MVSSHHTKFGVIEFVPISVDFRGETMSDFIRSLRRRFTFILAIVIAVALYESTRLPALSQSEESSMAARFKFKKQPLPEPQGHPYKFIRAVHPSLENISAWISTLGAAVAIADLDGDGLANDLCYVDPRTDLVTVAPVPNTGARYEAFDLNPAPLPYDSNTMAPMGCLAGDFNEDGLTDLLVYYWGRAPIIFLRQSLGGGNNSILKYADYVARELIPIPARWFTNAATLADFDGDGHTDLLICNYFQDGAHILDANAAGVEVMHDTKAKSFNGGQKHLLLWTEATGAPQPAASFIDKQDTFDEKVSRGWTLAVGAADMDGDLLPEIYFANDFGPDRLLHNRSTQGNPSFALLEGEGGINTPSSFVLGKDSFKGMGVDFGDLNCDGIPDIYVSNITSEFGLQESHFLWLSTGETARMNEGIAPYKQSSEELGLSRSGWGWDARLADFDNDSIPEAIQATGFLRGKINRWPELQSLGTVNSQIMHDARLWPPFRPGADLSGYDKMPFFVRGKDGRYYDVAAQVGLTEPMVSRGIAIADVDGDGRLDFAVANQWETSYFFHNESPDAGGFIGLHLLLPVGASQAEPFAVRDGHPPAGLLARNAIGATATLHLEDDCKVIAQVDGGTGHSGKRSPDIHFGLGHVAESAALQVDLKWRGIDGQVRQRSLYLCRGWYTILLN